MLKKRVSYVKGHMGGDEIVLLDGHDIPSKIRKKVALSVLYSPSIRGREAGILYKKNENNLSVKIVELTSRDYIPMCGGLTQVLGRSLIETDFRDKFDIKVKEPITEIRLDTDAGIFPINIEVKNGKVRNIFTGMKTYVKRCKLQGFEEISEKVKAIRTGIFDYIFTAIEYENLSQLYPHINFWQLTPEVIKKLDEVRSRLGKKFLYTIIYEKRGTNLFRAAFRFLPPDPLTMEEEFACGTGTTALGLILYHKKIIDMRTSEPKIKLILKGELESLDSEITILKLKIKNKEIIDAEFSHSNVEIISEGNLFL